jgi:hypothetical protein
VIGLALALLACAGDPSATAGPTLAEGAATTIFASQAALGPHVMRVSVRRTARADDVPGEQVSEETMLLRWQDSDHWRLERARDGRAVEGLTVWDNVAWQDERDGRVRKPDAEPARVTLAQTWDPWRLALEQVEAALVLTDVGVETREGRKAHRHAVSAKVAAAPPSQGEPARGARKRPPRARRGAFTVTAASGDVWIDEATAVRLAADVRVEAREGAKQHIIELRLALEEIGGDAGVAPVAASPPPAPVGGPPTGAPSAGDTP